jgi:hypothetical protein
MRNAVDIIQPFIEADAHNGRRQLLSLGGVASAALVHPDSRISLDERLIVAPSGLYIPQYRDTKEQNLRDTDWIMKTTDPDEVAAGEALTDEYIGEELKRSVFGFHTSAELAQQAADPWKTIKSSFVSDRYADTTESGDLTNVKKALFPFAVELPDESLDTWHIKIGDRPLIPTMHPGTILGNYVSRSTAGLRHKDARKVHELAHNIVHIEPKMRDWMMGPGYSQLVLGSIFQRLGSVIPKKPLVLGGVIPMPNVKLHDMASHEAFMLDDASLASRVAMVGLAHVKALPMRAYENNEVLVDMWQRYNLEDRFKRIVHNDTAE